MNTIPLHSYDLIDDLTKDYPEEVYRPGMDWEEFLMRQGERRLVLRLRRLREMELEDQIQGR